MVSLNMEYCLDFLLLYVIFKEEVNFQVQAFNLVSHSVESIQA